MLNDVRYALRLLRRSPGFTVAAVLTLALGIGVNTAIYSVLQAVWIDAVPFADPGRLVSLASAGDFSRSMAVSEEDFAVWRSEATSFASLGAVDNGGTLEVNGQKLATSWASPDLFGTLGGVMHLGRGLQPGDGAADGPIVAVLSHRAWQRTFGADPAIVGRRLTSRMGPVEIVGVAPPGFQLSSFVPGAWVSRKLVPPQPGRAGARSLQVFGRLKAGATVEDARAELNVIAARLAAERPASNARWPAVTVIPIRARLAGPGVGDSLWLLLAATLTVLLIACANIANLFLARATHRTREMAVRSALGARPARIVRQMLSETAVVAAAASGVALLLAMWAREAIVAGLPPNLHRASEIAIDGRVMFFTLVAGAATALLTGMVPALRGSVARPLEVLSASAQRSSRTRAHRRFSNLLIVGELALAIVVMSVAGLLVGSFLKLRHVDPGFEARSLLTFTVSRDPAARGGESSRAVHEQLSAVLAAVPHVRGIAAAEMLPLSGNRSTYPHRAADAAATIDLDQRFVTPGYFEVMSIGVKAGRTFGVGDVRGQVVINERAAQQLWPGQSAVGRTIYNGNNPDTVIGVVADVRHTGLDGDPVAEIYRISYASPEMTYVVRTDGDPAAIARSIEAAVAPTMPLKIAEMAPMDDLVLASVRVPQFRARLFGLMGLLVGLLAVIGVASVTACAVAERRREIGIRMALGAAPGRTVRLILGQAVRPALVGIFLGFTIALNTNRLVAHLLFATSPADPLTLLGVVTTLLATVLLAAYIPARRVQAVDPTIALKAD